EREQHDALRRNPLGEQPGHAGAQCRRLARARARQNQKRPARERRGRPLLGVELLEPASWASALEHLFGEARTALGRGARSRAPGPALAGLPVRARASMTTTPPKGDTMAISASIPKARVHGIEDVRALKDQVIGPSGWREVSQEMINQFADLTGDHQWIHVDVDRAKLESPFGTTIAHGNLTLSRVD